MYGLIDLQRKFLTSLTLAWAVMLTNVVTLGLQISFNLLFVSYLEWGLDGLGVSYNLTQLVSFVFILVCTGCINDIKEAVQWPGRESLQHWSPYVKLSLAGMIMFCVEWSF